MLWVGQIVNARVGMNVWPSCPVRVEDSFIWAAAQQNQQNDLCTQWILRSTWASAQSDQSLLLAWRSIGSLAAHWAHSNDWSDWVDAQAGDLSLHWTHRSFCWFCHVAAHIVISTLCLLMARFPLFTSSTWLDQLKMNEIILAGRHRWFNENCNHKIGGRCTLKTEK